HACGPGGDTGWGASVRKVRDGAPAQPSRGLPAAPQPAAKTAAHPAAKPAAAPAPAK
ncbi:transcriptional regulator, partial [Stenotrophomonas acidaminiphila]|nr:transcriptional regulator [Stenotrophomonas acidaminiphila]